MKRKHVLRIAILLCLCGLLLLVGAYEYLYLSPPPTPVADAVPADRDQLAREIPGAVLLWSRDGWVTASGLSPWKPVRITRGENPRWSPDGRRFVFTRGHDVYLMSRHPGKPRRILGPVVTAYATGAYWTPDGRAVVAISRRNPRQVILLALNSGERSIIHDEGQPPFKGYRLSQGADLRFDRRYLLTFTADSGHRSMIIDLVARSYITNELMRKGDCGPSWSPDGRFIVMTRRNRLSPTRPIYAARFDPRQRVLSPSRYLIGRGRCHRPRVSSDSRWVLYVLSGNIYCWPVKQKVEKPRNGIQLTFDGKSTDPALYVFRERNPEVFR